MKPWPHTYDVRLTGGPEGHATLTVAGLPDVRSAPPLAFDGPGDAWSPELRGVARATRVRLEAVIVGA
jgi:hypothetical protein